jgi:hypothetical protein
MSLNSTQHLDNMRRRFFEGLPEGLTLTDFDSLPETERKAWDAAFSYAYRRGFMACKVEALESLKNLGKRGAK